jgi:MFS family permease
MLYSPRPISGILIIEVIGAGFMALGIVTSGIISDRYGRRTTLGIFALMIAILSGFIPILMGGDEFRQNIFILVGFALLGLSYGQAAGAVNANFPLKYRYTGAALTSDISWLVGAGFAPLVALALAAHFGLEYVSLYLLSGAFCTLAALSINRVLEIRD